MKTVYNADGTVMNSGQLATFNAMLATRQFLFANLFLYTLVDGTVLYYCGCDTDISFGGNIYSAGGTVGPFFDGKSTKATYHCKIGTAVDTLAYDVLPGSSTIEGIPFVQACQQGVFDGAEVTLHRAYWSTIGYQTPPIIPNGVIGSIFVGRVAEVYGSRSIVTFSINSHLELLNQNMPVELYQSGCVNTLYGTACTLNQASFVVSGSASSGSTAAVVNSSLSQATGYFGLGKIKFTSGANSGVWRGVKQYTHGSPSVIALSSPLPFAPVTSDTFTIYPGCDKQQSTCSGKFSNLVNFRGFPYIPDTSTAV